MTPVPYEVSPHWKLDAGLLTHFKGSTYVHPTPEGPVPIFFILPTLRVLTWRINPSLFLMNRSVSLQTSLTVFSFDCSSFRNLLSDSETPK